MLATLTLLALLWPVFGCDPNTECGGMLSGYDDHFDNASDCNYVDIMQPSGVIYRRTPFPGCTDSGANGAPAGVPRSCMCMNGGFLYWISGTGQYVWQTQDSTAATLQSVPLPMPYNFSLGLGYVDGLGLFMLTTSTLYYASEANNLTSFQVIVDGLSFSKSAVLIGDYWDPYFYVTDGSVLYTFNVTIPSKVQWSTLNMTGLNNVNQLDVYGTSPPGTLLAFQDESLYWLSFTDGTSKWIMDLPQGSGVPLSSAISGEVLFVADNVTIWTLDVLYGVVLTQYPFNGQALVSPFQFHY